MEKKIKLIVDADVGTDDAVAITALALAPNVEILGVTCVHGNTGVEFTTENTLRLVDFLGLNIPVYKGCPTPMVRHLTPGRICNPLMETVKKEINGVEIGIHEKIICHLPQTNRKKEKEHACSYIVNTLRESREKITIAAVGPLTNIATALTMAPEIVEKIEAIYVMGGGINKGNRTPVAEANFYDDPEAAQIVLKSGAKVILAPLESSGMGFFDEKFLQKAKKINNKISNFIVNLSRDFICRMKKLGLYDVSADSCQMYDWGAVAPIIDPSLIVDMKKEICQVDINGGFADGMLIIDKRGFLNIDSNVYIIYSLDEKKMKENYLNLLKNNEVQK